MILIAIFQLCALKEEIRRWEIRAKWISITQKVSVQVRLWINIMPTSLSKRVMCLKRRGHVERENTWLLRFCHFGLRRIYPHRIYEVPASGPLDIVSLRLLIKAYLQRSAVDFRFRILHESRHWEHDTLKNFRILLTFIIVQETGNEMKAKEKHKHFLGKKRMQKQLRCL